MILAPTIAQRSTVTENFREILSDDLGLRSVKFKVPSGADAIGVVIRRVQVLVPTSPSTYLICAPDPRFVDGKTGEPITNMAMAAGLDRVYKGMLLTPGAQIAFHLLPEQSLWAACEEGYSELGLICEYLKPIS